MTDALEIVTLPPTEDNIRANGLIAGDRDYGIWIAQESRRRGQPRRKKIHRFRDGRFFVRRNLGHWRQFIVGVKALMRNGEVDTWMGVVLGSTRSVHEDKIVKNQGFSCWARDCRNSFDLAVTTPAEIEVRAALAGWVIGHWDGQSHYACPDCRESLWDAVPITHHMNEIEEVVVAVACIAIYAGLLAREQG